MNHDLDIRPRRGRMSAVALVVIMAVAVAGCSRPGGEDSPPASSVGAPESLDEISREAERQLSLGSTEASPHVVLGKVAEAEGDLASAEQAYLRSLAIDPGQPAVLHDLAVLYFDRGDLAGAERSLRSALGMDPALHGSRLLLADVMAKAGDVEEARRQVSLVLEAAPRGVDEDMLRARLESYR